jgi:hypothetical protein
MVLGGATLAAVGLQVGHRQAYGDAGVTAVAMRTVGENAAASESRTDQRTVNFGVDEVGRGGDLRSGLMVRQVTARIGEVA